jgi:tRNA/rRNA methyltransferase
MGTERLACIRIVLVSPAGDRNIGSVARVMKNMGLAHLVIVAPRCDPFGEDARRMAVRGSDVLERATLVPDLPQALSGCQRAIATLGREQSTLEIPLESPRQALPWLLATDKSAEPPTALIFGPEDRGLNNLELNYAQRFVRIPAEEVYPSLNLAQAVAICCYELHVAALAGLEPTPAPMAPPHLEQTDLATLDGLEQYYQDLTDLLLTIGYLYPHTATSRMKKIRQLLKRAYPSNAEVTMLHGMVSQMKWALKSGKFSQMATSSDGADENQE